MIRVRVLLMCWYGMCKQTKNYVMWKMQILFLHTDHTKTISNYPFNSTILTLPPSFAKWLWCLIFIRLFPFSSSLIQQTCVQSDSFRWRDARLMAGSWDIPLRWSLWSWHSWKMLLHAADRIPAVPLCTKPSSIRPSSSLDFHLPLRMLTALEMYL